jgi:hypothetical protein
MHKRLDPAAYEITTRTSFAFYMSLCPSVDGRHEISFFPLSSVTPVGISFLKAIKHDLKLLNDSAVVNPTCSPGVHEAASFPSLTRLLLMRPPKYLRGSFAMYYKPRDLTLCWEVHCFLPIQHRGAFSNTLGRGYDFATVTITI